MREIILDTETTGLNFKGGDRIIEVACFELINHIPSGNNLQFYCSTSKKITEEAIKIHGLTNDFLNNHPTFEEQVKKFLDFIKRDKLIIHNAEFDLGFINNELNLIGEDRLKNEVIDTVSLARKKLNTRIANLDYLCRRFSIDLSNRKLHGALEDCRLLSEVYIELLGGRQTSLELAKQTQKNRNQNEKKNITPSAVNKIILTSEEIEKHKIFIKDLKNNIWNKSNN